SVALGTAGVSLVELTAAYAAIAGGRYPVEPRGLALVQEDDGFTSFFRRGGSLDRRRDWAPMLDLLWEAANKGTGHRAALAIPTFGKTGTSQGNRDALFIGFAGNLVVGVWVGRDDNKSLGKITGGTAPARIWRSFMVPALAVDGRVGPPLPKAFRGKPAPPPTRREKKSPLPEDWSERTRGLREMLRAIEDMIEDSGR
ncbi:MAG TPA: hypothetical protein VE403_04730, partial [Sphingomicrobium sp.]|nr:hypothetical protein [Sphingomicrobium sp.]